MTDGPQKHKGGPPIKYHDERHAKQRERMRLAYQWRRQAHKDYLAMRDKGPRLYRHRGPVGGRKHPDRPLPVWGLVLDCMVDGKWYTTGILKVRLAGVPYSGIKAALHQRCFGKGLVRRVENSNYDPRSVANALGDARRGRPNVHSWAPIGSLGLGTEACRYAYRITEAGRAALAAVQAKYCAAMLE